MRAKEAVWLPVCFRAVTESINQLITLCTQQAAGQKECDNALRELEVAFLTYRIAHRGFLVYVHACISCFLIKVYEFCIFFLMVSHYFPFDSSYIAMFYSWIIHSEQ